MQGRKGVGVGHEAGGSGFVRWPHSNIAEQLVFGRTVEAISSESVDLLQCSPPSSSSWVSCSRDVPGSGPYGCPGIQPAHKEQVGVGTLLALRGAAACTAAQSQSITPWIVEQPQHQASDPAFLGLTSGSILWVRQVYSLCPPVTICAHTQASTIEWLAILSLCCCSMMWKS